MYRSDVDADIVAQLLREQFPQWADLAIRPVELDGWDNATFRLGDEMSVRLPRFETCVPQIEKEHRWLPVLARHVPLPIPTPVAMGAPGCGFPWPWSVYQWIDGEPAALAGVRDLDRLADDLAGFLAALHQVSTDGGPIPGPDSYHRGGPIALFDDATRATIDQLERRIDTAGALEVWDAAISSPSDGRVVWVHGDMTASNFIVRHDRVCGVIDFGCSAIGDAACDLTLAWTTFEGSSRRRFMQTVPVDGAAWARGRGWALWKAVIALPRLPDDHPRNDGTRFGWRWTARGVVDQIIADFRSAG